MPELWDLRGEVAEYIGRIDVAAPTGAGYRRGVRVSVGTPNPLPRVPVDKRRRVDLHCNLL